MGAGRGGVGWRLCEGGQTESAGVGGHEGPRESGGRGAGHGGAGRGAWRGACLGDDALGVVGGLHLLDGVVEERVEGLQQTMY